MVEQLILDGQNQEINQKRNFASLVFTYSLAIYHLKALIKVKQQEVDCQRLQELILTPGKKPKEKLPFLGPPQIEASWVHTSYQRFQYNHYL